MRLILLIALVIGMAGSAPPVWTQSTPAGAMVEASTLKMGDAVRITVWDYPTLGGTFEIAEDGTLIHPIFRSVRAAGLTHQQLEAEVRTVLQRFEQEPRFVVEPLYRVWIAGEVRSPNVYTVAPSTPILQAVAQAGGPTELAQLKEVRVLRDGGELEVDLTRPYAEIAHLRVRSGDQIIVPRRDNFWRDNIRPVLTTASSVASLSWALFRLYRYLN